MSRKTHLRIVRDGETAPGLPVRHVVPPGPIMKNPDADLFDVEAMLAPPQPISNMDRAALSRVAEALRDRTAADVGLPPLPSDLWGPEGEASAVAEALLDLPRNVARDEIATALDLLWEYRRKDGLPTYPTLDAVKRLGGVARDPRDDI